MAMDENVRSIFAIVILNFPKKNLLCLNQLSPIYVTKKDRN